MDQSFDWILRNSLLAVVLNFAILEHVGWL